MVLAADLVQDFEEEEQVEEVVEEQESVESEESESSEEEQVEEEVDDSDFFADDESIKEEQLPPAPTSFTPEEKYIVDNLPLISVRVVMDDDSVKTVQVRSAAELPRDAKGYASFHEGEVFKQNVTAQELKARELQTYYRNHQTQLQADEYDRKENLAIREDIRDLRKEGRLPALRGTPGTKEFDESPAGKIIQEVIDLMNDRNARYLERSNKGSAYRHIGFADAFELLHGNDTKADTKNSSARKEAARKLVSKQGGSTNKTTKSPISGRTIKEVAAEFDDFGE